jgi:hypothetical protein
MNIRECINTFTNKAETRRLLAESLGMKEVTIRSWANGNIGIRVEKSGLE